MALRIWPALAAAISIAAILVVPTHPSSISTRTSRARIFIAIILQSCGYGILQPYLNTYAQDVTLLLQTSATLLATLLNAPVIVSSSFFGYLGDRKRYSLSDTTVTAISGTYSAFFAFFFWGLASHGSLALMFLFSMTFSFFAGGYSATWGSLINEMELEAAGSNEAIDAGMVYGMLNVARGLRYVSDELASVPLPRALDLGSSAGFGYGAAYRPLIVVTWLSSIFGGWGVLWKWKWKKGLHCF